MAAAVRASLLLVQSRPDRREKLWRNVRLANEALAPLGLSPSGSQIIPIILRDDQRAMDAATALQAKDFDVRGIRPPTVPPGTSRLRVSITLNVTEEDIRSLFHELANVLEAAQPAL
jgi:8-amino-7-oxononanoate synthase